MSRHERSNALPPFQIALAYEVIFRVSVTDLFPSVYYAIEDGIARRLSDLESTLQHTSTSERVLEWMRERRLGID